MTSLHKCLNRIFKFFSIISCLQINLATVRCQQQDRSHTEVLIDSVFTFLRDGTRQMNEEPPNRKNILREYDFIIVGAGTAGCVLANRLSEVPEWKILLIEAGDRENFLMDIPILANYLQFTKANWKYKTKPSRRSCVGFTNDQCRWPRGKVMGGSSVLNYMIYTRGGPKDYDNWENMGNPGWGWNDVFPYFRRIENYLVPTHQNPTYHNRGGMVDVSYPPYTTNVASAWVKSAVEAGYKFDDHNGRSQVGVDFIQVSLSNGTRHSSSRAYLHPVSGRPNLHVIKNAMVVNLLNKENKIIGVEVMRGNKRYKIYSKKETIVSAGAVNSPQLLMLSGIGPKQDLSRLGIKVLQDLKVGYNLMDHIAAGGLTFTLNRQNFTLSTAEILGSTDMIFQWLRTHKGPLGIPGGVEAILFQDTNNRHAIDGWPDIELLFVAGSVNSDDALRNNFGFKQEIFEEVYGMLGDTQTFMVMPMLLRPKSKGRIMLNSKNPRSYPIIEPNYFAYAEDVNTMVRATKEAVKISEQPALRKLGTKLHDAPIPTCKHLGFGTDAYWACHAKHFTFTIYHACGTCKMGPRSDPTAVVDSRLKVHGIKGLRVIDASIIPEIPAAHTNAPTYMIAEKGADMIKEDWKHSISN